VRAVAALAKRNHKALWQNETKIARDFTSGLLRERQLARLMAALSHRATLPNPPLRRPAIMVLIARANSPSS